MKNRDNAGAIASMAHQFRYIPQLDGLRAVAIVFVHGYRYREHEKRSDQINDSVSDVRRVLQPRGHSTCADQVVCEHHEQDGKAAELVDSCEPA